MERPVLNMFEFGTVGSKLVSVAIASVRLQRSSFQGGVVVSVVVTVVAVVVVAVAVGVGVVSRWIRCCLGTWLKVYHSFSWAGALPKSQPLYSCPCDRRR